MKRIADIGQAAIRIIGVLGTLTCMGVMVLAAIGVAGASASATMAGMSMGTSATSGLHPGFLAFLTGDPAGLHWRIRPVTRDQAMGGCHPRAAGG